MSKKKLTGLTDKYWITDFNYLDEVRGQFHLPERVYIHDVTLREAEQAPHIALRPDEKIRIFQALDDMGVHSVEIFPLVSNEDKELSKELVKMPRQAKVFFLCRWNEWEVDFALEAGADGIVIECAGTPQALSTALSLVRGAGQVLLLGVSGEETPLVEAMLIQREIELKASLAYSEDEIRLCLDFLAQRRFNTEGMVSDIISLDDIVEKGFERLVSTKGLIKVVVAP